MNNEPQASPTVEECRYLEQELLGDIQDLLDRFSKRTGLKVDRIGVDPVHVFGGNFQYVVDLEVKL